MNQPTFSTVEYASSRSVVVYKGVQYAVRPSRRHGDHDDPPPRGPPREGRGQPAAARRSQLDHDRRHQRRHVARRCRMGSRNHTCTGTRPALIRIQPGRDENGVARALRQAARAVPQRRETPHRRRFMPRRRRRPAGSQAHVRHRDVPQPPRTVSGRSCSVSPEPGTHGHELPGQDERQHAAAHTTSSC